MKTPKEIIDYRNKVIELFTWAVENGHISEEQSKTLKDNIYDIELEMYPKKKIKDENGWNQFESEYIYGLPIDEWE